MVMNIIVGFCITRSKGKKVIPLVDYVLNVVGFTFFCYHHLYYVITVLPVVILFVLHPIEMPNDELC